MSIEILDCLKRKRDVCIKNIIPGRNTAFTWTPTLKPDKIRHVTKLIVFFSGQWATEMLYITAKFNYCIIVLMALSRICPEWPTYRGTSPTKVTGQNVP